MPKKENDELLSIGAVATRVGIAASAIRYYEKERLLRPVAREAGKRRYDQRSVDRIEMIQLAKAVGFSLGEIRQLLVGFDRDGLPKTWCRMAASKIEELKRDRARISMMVKMLETALDCDCADLGMCVSAARRQRLTTL